MITEEPFLNVRNTEVKISKEESSTANTTSLKSFHYLENGEVNFSILETKYSTKKLDAGIYKLSTSLKNGVVLPSLAVSNDRELFDDDLGFYYEDKIKNIIPSNLKIDNYEEFIIKAVDYYSKHLERYNEKER